MMTWLFTSAAFAASLQCAGAFRQPSLKLCKPRGEGEPLLANPARVCVADGQPGLSNRNESSLEFDGLEPDVARYIVETINGPGAGLEFVVTAFPQRIEFLQSCKCDFLVELLTNTAGRRKQVGFTSPYLSPALEIMAAAASSVDSADDCDSVALVERSATESSFRALFPETRLITFATNEEAIKSLADGQASCAASEDIVFKRILEQMDAGEINLLSRVSSRDLRRVGTGNTFEPKPWGIGVNIEQVELRAEIDAAVVYAEMSGKFRSLREKHGFASCLACV